MTKQKRSRVAAPFLRLCGLTLSAYLSSRQADTALERIPTSGVDRDFLNGKIACAQCFCLATSPIARALSKVTVDRRRWSSDATAVFEPCIT